jgi:hypothetical protein
MDKLECLTLKHRFENEESAYERQDAKCGRHDVPLNQFGSTGAATQFGPSHGPGAIWAPHFVVLEDFKLTTVHRGQ